MRSAALALPVFFVLRFVPFLSIVGLAGFCGLSLAVPAWALRWWIRFGAIPSSNSDYRQSRRAVRTVGIVVTCVLVLYVILPFVVGFLHPFSRPPAGGHLS
jgi:hypothetical protein